MMTRNEYGDYNDPAVFIIGLEHIGRQFYDGTCRSVATYLTNTLAPPNYSTTMPVPDDQDYKAYLVYREIVSQIFDFMLEVPGGVTLYDYMLGLQRLPIANTIIGQDTVGGYAIQSTHLKEHQVVLNLLRTGAQQFGMDLFYLLKNSGFFYLASLYVVNWDCQIHYKENLKRLYLIRLAGST